MVVAKISPPMLSSTNLPNKCAYDATSVDGGESILVLQRVGGEDIGACEAEQWCGGGCE
jgi:hypothetical protein